MAVGSRATRLLPRYLSLGGRIGLTVFALAPVVGLLWLSLMPSLQIINGGLAPRRLSWSNYVNAWTQVNMAAGIAHTLIIAGTGAAVCVLCSVGIAYVISRLWKRRTGLLMGGLFAAQTAPGTVLLLPLFILFVSFQAVLHITILGTYGAIIVTYVSFGLPLSVWLMWMYMESVPEALEEAARVDGASRLVALWYVILPLMIPGMIVTGVLVFIGEWNDVLFASVLTNQNTRTVAIALQQFLETQGGFTQPEYGPLMAGAVIAAVPVVLLYLLFQRHLVRGLSLGAVKG